MTLKIWPRIRNGPEAEVKYYESLLSGEKLLPKTKKKTLANFGKLSQQYGPLPMDMEKYKVVNKATWTSSYRAVYDTYWGSDKELLAQMAKAYYQTKLKFSVADVNNDIKLKLSVADVDKDSTPTTVTNPTETEADPKPHDSETRAGPRASKQPAAIKFGQSFYDYAHEDDNDDDDSNSEHEEDEYDQDEIFDDHNIEQYGRQGYGGWD